MREYKRKGLFHIKLHLILSIGVQFVKHIFPDFILSTLSLKQILKYLLDAYYILGTLSEMSFKQAIQTYHEIDHK